MKSKNRSISKPVAPPKVVTNDAENLSARNISFVVQGQIQPETYTFLQAQLSWYFLRGGANTIRAFAA